MKRGGVQNKPLLKRRKINVGNSGVVVVNKKEIIKNQKLKLVMFYLVQHNQLGALKDILHSVGRARRILKNNSQLLSYWDGWMEVIKYIRVLLGEGPPSGKSCPLGLPCDSPELVQLVAARQNGYAVQLIQNPSEEVQLVAVRENGKAIKYINNPSEEVQLTAVEQNANAIRYIYEPSKQAQLLATKKLGITTDC